MSDFEYDDYSEEDEEISFDEVTDAETGDEYSGNNRSDDDDGSSYEDLDQQSGKPSGISLQRVEYKPNTSDELLNDLHNEVRKLSSILNLDEDDCYILSHYFNWNIEKLMEQFMDNFDETRLKAGLSIDQTPKVNHIHELEEPFTCDICCDEKTSSFALSCNHRYCTDCYIYYLKEKTFANSRLIKCPYPSCHLNLLPTKDIKVVSDYMILKGITADVKDIEDAKIAAREHAEKVREAREEWSDSDDESIDEAIFQLKPWEVERSLFERYEDGSIKIYVESHSNYKWCPSPDCPGLVCLQNVSKNYLKELSIEHKNNLIPVVSCPFGHSFCFMCNFENHIPVPCWITNLWIQKCKDDSETANWINANTKSCPKCESTIEKNGGCNHMTCKKCKYEFCWICMGIWSKHGQSYYNCSMYNNSDTIEIRNKQENSKTSLKRYLHYYNHFTAQEQSMKGDLLFCSDIENKLMRIQENLKNEVSWIELQFYKDSVNTLLRCRRTLKWSYALVYYLRSSNFTTILTDNQLHLSNNVEKLSKLFEIFQPEQIMSKKREFNSVSDYLLKREKLLIECSIEGIMKGELHFNVDENGTYLD